jgi:hypothetical protein
MLLAANGNGDAMAVGLWLMLIGGAIGAGVAIYGLVTLVTGRGTRGDQRAFRRRTEAGSYYLCFGLALVLLTTAGLLNEHDQTAQALATLVAAMTLTGLAVVRYRPRRSGRR